MMKIYMLTATKLKALLHVIPSDYVLDDLSEGETEIETLGRENITITGREGQVSKKLHPERKQWS